MAKSVIMWQVESSWSGSYKRRVLKRKLRDNNHPELTLVSLTSSVTPQPVGLPLGAVVPSLSIHLSPYALVSLRTHLSTHLSPYILVSLCTRLFMYSFYCYVHIPAGRTFRLGIYLKLSTCRGVIFDCCSMQRGSSAVGWTQSTLLPCVVVSLASSRLE